MIVTKEKDKNKLLEFLKGEDSVFILGCGECATACKTGGEKEVNRLKEFLEGKGKTVTGIAMPDAPCIASQVRTVLGKNKKAIKGSDALMLMACGLGAQCLKENLREPKPVHVTNDTIFMGELDKSGNFFERCSACGECIIEATGGMCPVTRCPKGLLNGPCGGVDKGKCEVDKEIDCVWALIYNELKDNGKLHLMEQYNPPKDYSKLRRPRSLQLT